MEKLIFKIYLKESGTVEKVCKDFHIYEGSYGHFDLMVFVPKNLMFENVTVEAGLSRIDQYGKNKDTQSYNLVYDIEKSSEEFCVFSRECPLEFTKIVGTHSLIINVKGHESSDVNNINKLVTTQIIKFSVEKSKTLIGELNPEYIENDDFELYRGYVNQLIQDLGEVNEIKADRLETVLKMSVNSAMPDYIEYNKNGYKTLGVLFYGENFDLTMLNNEITNHHGAVLVINFKQDSAPTATQLEIFICKAGVFTREIKLNTSQADINLYPVVNVGSWTYGENLLKIINLIEDNATNINLQAQQIADLDRRIKTGEHYVATVMFDHVPSDDDLTEVVSEHEDRAPKEADVVFYIVEDSANTNKVYKARYEYNQIEGAWHWDGYEIPGIQLAENDEPGLIEGTATEAHRLELINKERNMAVDVQNGQILDIKIINNKDEVESIADSIVQTQDNVILNKADIDKNREDIDGVLTALVGPDQDAGPDTIIGTLINTKDTAEENKAKIEAIDKTIHGEDLDDSAGVLRDISDNQENISALTENKADKIPAQEDVAWGGDFLTLEKGRVLNIDTSKTLEFNLTNGNLFPRYQLCGYPTVDVDENRNGIWFGKAIINSDLYIGQFYVTFYSYSLNYINEIKPTEVLYEARYLITDSEGMHFRNSWKSNNYLIKHGFLNSPYTNWVSDGIYNGAFEEIGTFDFRTDITVQSRNIQNTLDLREEMLEGFSDLSLSKVGRDEANALYLEKKKNTEWVVLRIDESVSATGAFQKVTTKRDLISGTSGFGSAVTTIPVVDNKARLIQPQEISKLNELSSWKATHDGEGLNYSVNFNDIPQSGDPNSLTVQDYLTTKYQTVSNNTVAPLDQTTLTDENLAVSYRWYVNDNKWILSHGSITGRASNDIHDDNDDIISNGAIGLVKGSDTSGKVFVEIDGTMSLNGYDAIKTDVTNNTFAINTLDSTKVDKITGKGLSTEDYTTNEKIKLAGIEAGAEVNDSDTLRFKGEWIEGSAYYKGDVVYMNVDYFDEIPDIGLDYYYFVSLIDNNLEIIGSSEFWKVMNGCSLISSAIQYSYDSSSKLSLLGTYKVTNGEDEGIAYLNAKSDVYINDDNTLYDTRGKLASQSEIPTKTSDLTNNGDGTLINGLADKFAKVSQIPTNNNQLVNDAGYSSLPNVENARQVKATGNTLNNIEDHTNLAKSDYYVLSINSFNNGGKVGWELFSSFGDSIAAYISTMLYPVGHIMMTTNPANPNTYLPGMSNTTWTQWGAGRVPVSVNTGDTLFNTADKTGGTKDSIVVSHTHTAVNGGAHSHSIYDPGHRHALSDNSGSGGPNMPSGDQSGDSNSDYMTTYSTTGISINENGDHTHTINSTGSSGVNANMPPFITCYMWKRTV